MQATCARTLGDLEDQVSLLSKIVGKLRTSINARTRSIEESLQSGFASVVSAIEKGFETLAASSNPVSTPAVPQIPTRQGVRPPGGKAPRHPSS